MNIYSKRRKGLNVGTENDNGSDMFDIGHCVIKVKVTVGILKVSAFITIQNVRFL